MTDRETAMATFKAVAALYHAFTGQPLSLTVETENGTVGIIDTPTPVRPILPAEE
jgi:hypothetical protein